MLSGLPLIGHGIAGLAPHWTLHQEVWTHPPMGKFALTHREEIVPPHTIDMGKLFPMMNIDKLNLSLNLGTWSKWFRQPRSSTTQTLICGLWLVYHNIYPIYDLLKCM